MLQKRFIAEVIDNNDTEQKGRVQIYISHIMENWETDHYPWAFPDNAFQSFIPEIGDNIWVWFEEEEYFKKPFYTHKVQFHESHDANKTIGSITGSYPNIKYIWLPNGVAIALNSNENEISITNGGAEIFINSDGEIHIKGSSGTLESSVLGETLKSWLEQHTHSSPVGPTGTSINASTLSTILSQKVKNN